MPKGLNKKAHDSAEAKARQRNRRGQALSVRAAPGTSTDRFPNNTSRGKSFVCKLTLLKLLMPIEPKERRR